MSLRVRLILLIAALVTFVALALSALHLNSLADSLSGDALAQSDLASRQVNALVIDRINQASREHESPADLAATKALWAEIVASDPDIQSALEKTIASAQAIVEINIAAQDGRILASSNPSRVGGSPRALEDLSVWRSRPFYRRMSDIVVNSPDYQVTVPLGIKDQSEPIFTTQVVASSVLLRSALLPQIQTLAEVSGGALLASLVLTVLVTNRILQPVRRIERTIDRITQGNFRGDSILPHDSAKEFAAVESKLNLLGQQFRGAQEDATELKHNLETMIERMASQLDVASRLAAISRISGSVAHEIKNPLNAISLHLDLLRARLDSPDEEIVREIDILSKEVRRLDRVVKTFLDFSRPVEVRLADVDLTSLAREVTELITPQARLARIEVFFRPGEPDQIRVRGDADLLKQAVLNLVTNAIEAMKEGGHLSLSLSLAGEMAVFEIADDGPGIPAELRDKVFQLYFTTKSQGSGIGLAMTYRAVQLHNGTIEFVSEGGRGTTFRLQFPAVVRHV